jgi:arginyl-tRNA--protein-N-Asp/Glu arginylyltransferase
MKSISRFVTLPSTCGYLPEQQWQLEYEMVASMTPQEYLERMRSGWRRFGYTMFRPRCPACTACRTLRVLADRFRPNRSQRRARRLNENAVRLEVGPPSVNRNKLDLYDRYHAFQAENKEWPLHAPKDVEDFALSYVENPFPVLEFCYYLGDRLVSVGYVDELPGALSAIYCFYDPDERHRSLGTWNVMSVIDAAVLSGIPHVYMGYFVAGCPSLEYKANFVPNQIRDPSGRWLDFRG